MGSEYAEKWIHIERVAYLWKWCCGNSDVVPRILSLRKERVSERMEKRMVVSGFSQEFLSVGVARAMQGNGSLTMFGA